MSSTNALLDDLQLSAVPSTVDLDVSFLQRRHNSKSTDGGNDSLQKVFASEDLPISYNRGQWASRTEFFLSCLGYAVGLGSVWRFPHLAGANGGAAFLIPYFIMTVFAGIPVFLLEMALGQYSKLSPYKLYLNLSPAFCGLGIGNVMTSFMNAIYYNMILGWSLYYLIASLNSQLPWATCGNDWNSKNCFDYKLARECELINETYANGRCLPANFSQLSFDPHHPDKNLALESFANLSRTPPAKEYYNQRVLGLSAGFDQIGTPRIELVGVLLAAWVITFACLVRGVNSTGKVVYFTALFPYVILVVLIGKAITLDGAADGLSFYLKPNFSMLWHPKVWNDAAGQVFFQLSLGGGGLSNLASYNEFDNNILRDTICIVVLDCFTGFFAGFAIFPVLGAMAKTLGKTVAELSDSGTGLAFIVYTEALTSLPVPPLWSSLFFFMLIVLAIGTELVLVQVIISAVCDQWPQLRPARMKALTVLSVCSVCFLLGIVLTCPGGAYMLQLMDEFACGRPLLILCLLEVCLVAWVYGFSRFLDDIQAMIGTDKLKFVTLLGYPINFWTCHWVVITPVMVGFIFLWPFQHYQYLNYGDYTFTASGEAVGWLMFSLCVAPVPIMALYKVAGALLSPGPKRKNLARIFQPTTRWLNFRKEIPRHNISGDESPVEAPMQQLHNDSSDCSLQTLSRFDRPLFE